MHHSVVRDHLQPSEHSVDAQAGFGVEGRALRANLATAMGVNQKLRRRLIEAQIGAAHLRDAAASAEVKKMLL